MLIAGLQFSNVLQGGEEMTAARQDLEESLARVEAALANVAATWPEDALQVQLQTAIRSVGERRRRLVSLPEMPMRTTEAEEVRHFIDSVIRDVKAVAKRDPIAVAAAMQPLVDVLQRHARPVNGKLRFPDEQELLSPRVPMGKASASVPPASLMERAVRVLNWLRSVKR